MTAGRTAAYRSAGVGFNEVQRVLSLFIQGLTGRSLHIEPLATLPTKDRPAHSVTDGAGIYLPGEIADFTSRRHNLGAYRIAVLHQIGYLQNGTFAFDLATALTFMPPSLASVLHCALRNFDGILPTVESASDLERFFAGWHRPLLLRRIFVTLEDLRIDTMIRRRYPGARSDLDRVLAHALSGRSPLHTLRPLAALIEGLVQFSLGAERDTLEACDKTGRQARLVAAASVVQRVAASVYDSAQAALDICLQLEELIDRTAPRYGNTAR